MPSESSSVFRVDKFVVPGHALPTFVEQLQRTKQTLDAIPGCRQNLVLTQLVGPGEYNVMTVVEWASPQAIVAAKDVVKKNMPKKASIRPFSCSRWACAPTWGFIARHDLRPLTGLSGQTHIPRRPMQPAACDLRVMVNASNP